MIIRNMIRPCSSSYSDSVPTMIRPDPTVLEQGSAAGQRRREVGIFPTLFRLGSDPDPTVFEVNTVGSGRCSSGEV